MNCVTVVEFEVREVPKCFLLPEQTDLGDHVIDIIGDVLFLR